MIIEEIPRFAKILAELKRENQILFDQIDTLRVKRFWRFKRKLNKEEREDTFYYLKLRQLLAYKVLRGIPQEENKGYWQRRREQKEKLKQIEELLKPLCESPFVQSIDLLNSSFTVMKGRQNPTITIHNNFKGFDDTLELYGNQERKNIFYKWF